MFGKFRSVVAGVVLLVCLGAAQAGGAAVPFPGAMDTPEDRWAAHRDAFAQDYDGRRLWRGPADDAERPGADERRFGHRKHRRMDRETMPPRWDADRHARGEAEEFQREREHRLMGEPEPGSLKQHPAPEIKNIVQPVQGTPKTVVTIPDPGLEAALREALSKPTGDLTDTDLAGITSLWASGRNIQSLTGLEYCLNLQSLSVYDNQLTSLAGLENATSLTELIVHGNLLTSLAGLENATNLQSLYAYDNQLSSLAGLENATNLQTLHTYNNQLASLTGLGNATKLQTLYAYNNLLSTLAGLGNATNLTDLDVCSNQLTSLAGLEHVPNLTDLDVCSNQLTSLAGLEHVPNLTYLDVCSNQLTSLAGLENVPNLTYLGVGGNQLTSLAGLEYATALYFLDAPSNQLTSLAGLESQPNLRQLRVGSNQLTSLAGLENATSLQYLSAYNNQLTSLAGLPSLPNLWHLNASGNQLASLAGLENAVALSELSLCNNQLTSLVGLPASLPDLNELLLADNQLVSLAGLPASSDRVIELDFSRNQLTNIQGLPAGSADCLFLNHNQITDFSPLAGRLPNFCLRVDGNPSGNLESLLAGLPNYLEMLGVSANQVTSATFFNAWKDSLGYLYISGLMADLDELSGFGNLRVLTLDSCGLTSLNFVASLDGLRLLAVPNNPLTSLEPLRNLSWLGALDVSGSAITDLSPLPLSEYLAWLDLRNTPVSDLSPLKPEMFDDWRGAWGGYDDGSISTTYRDFWPQCLVPVPLVNLSGSPASTAPEVASLRAVGITVVTDGDLCGGSEDSVSVPSVTGLTQAAAQTAVTGAGLTVGTVTQQCSDTVPAGSVVSQNPTAGTQAAGGTPVDLTVSSGPCPVPVPNVTGMMQAAAHSALTGAGLTVGTVTEAFSDSVPSGAVISQYPSAGAQVSPGSAVALVVSQGVDPASLASARASLAAAFKNADTDGDGFLSFAEAQAALPSLTQVIFDALDTDGDGLLSAEELGVGADGCGCGCKKSDMTVDGLKARLGDLFLGALALVLLAGAGRTRK